MKALSLNEKTLRLLGVINPHLFGSWFPNILAISTFLLFSFLLFWGCFRYVMFHSDNLNKSASAIYVVISMIVSIGSHIAMFSKTQNLQGLFSNIRSIVTESTTLSKMNTPIAEIIIFVVVIGCKAKCGNWYEVAEQKSHFLTKWLIIIYICICITSLFLLSLLLAILNVIRGNLDTSTWFSPYFVM